MHSPMPPPSAGWYLDPSGGPSLRYWDGRTWTADCASMPRPAPIVDSRGLSEPQRAAALDQELMAMMARGGRVEGRMPTSAIVVTGEPVNHVLHLLVTVLLCGFWLPAWIIIALNGGESRVMVSVDENGYLHRTTRVPAAPASPTANWLGRMSENQATLVVIATLIVGIALIAFVAHLVQTW